MMKKVLFLLFVGCVVKAQTVVVSEDFSNGLPKDWSVTTNHKYRAWKAKSYKDYHYMNMSAFGGKNKPIDEVETMLITPLISDSLEGCKLKFAFADAYSNGQPLHVYLVNEKNQLIKGIDTKYHADFVDNTGRYDNQFQSTEWIPLPQLLKPYHVAFRYRSEGKISTTIQLDAVDIWCE